ncbi:MAG: transporter, partial [Candidatus Methanomethylicia archaeon]
IQDYTFSTKSKVNGNKFSVANSTLNSASFKFGAAWALSNRVSLNIGISMGLTSDAPDYNLEIRIPYRF